MPPVVTFCVREDDICIAILPLGVLCYRDSPTTTCGAGKTSCSRLVAILLCFRDVGVGLVNVNPSSCVCRHHLHGGHSLLKAGSAFQAQNKVLSRLPGIGGVQYSMAWFVIRRFCRNILACKRAARKDAKKGAREERGPHNFPSVACLFLLLHSSSPAARTRWKALVRSSTRDSRPCFTTFLEHTAAQCSCLPSFVRCEFRFLCLAPPCSALLRRRRQAKDRSERHGQQGRQHHQQARPAQLLPHEPVRLPGAASVHPTPLAAFFLPSLVFSRLLIVLG